MTPEAMVASKDNAILPRRYQEEIFQKAQESNVIAALDTGSGKTFICTMLIRWVTSCDSALGKVVVFLVPKVPLVEQQGDFIAKQTPLRVCKLHGVIGLDMSDRAGWREKFKTYDVFVSTAQTFLNLLTHSHCSIDKISLMVFDECHHTRKNHPYNGIMREYFQIPPKRRPKIFGMTASPVWNPKDATASLAALEHSLDAKLIAVRLHDEELALHVPKPIEVIRVYDSPPDRYDYQSPSLAECLRFFPSLADLDIRWSNIYSRYQVTHSEIGPYGAELYLFTSLQHHLGQSLRDSMDLTTDGFGSNVEAERQASPLELDLFHIQGIVNDFRPLFQCDSDPDLPPVSIPFNWCSPKVKALVDILIEHYSPTFQGIVFVEQRQVAACLAKILSGISSLKGLIRCMDLVGHNTPTDALKSMAARKQNEVLRQFREKTINLIVATSVAEEGLDFPACDIVVRFDTIQHLVGYVQSRGRARNKASKFVVMIQKDQESHLARYRTFANSEPELRRTYQNHEHQPRQGAEEEEEEEGEVDPNDLAERERYVIKSTGASLTYDTSISLINYLCSLVPVERYMPPVLPKYSGDFQSILKLPRRLPLPPNFTKFVGPPKRSKKEAKRAVAFMAVKKLHKLAVFDDYLLPAFCGKQCADDGIANAQDEQQIPEIMDVLVWNPWNTCGTLWLHVVYLDGCPTAALITGTMLPEVHLGYDGNAYRVEGARPMCFDEDQREMLNTFTKLGISFFNTTRPIRPPLTCFLIPITIDLEPDFELMQFVIDNPGGDGDWGGIEESAYDRLLVFNMYERGRIFLLRRIRHDLTPMSSPSPCSRETGFGTYRDYFLEKIKRRNKPDWQPEIIEDLPLLELVRLPMCTDGAYDLLSTSSPHSTPRSFNVPNGTILPQNWCRWNKLSLELCRVFTVLPRLCRRITDVYRARQARFELGLPPIKDNLLIEALTLPPSQAKWSNQRLETLGDSVLKLTTSVNLFNKYPYCHEGQLSPMRHAQVSNRTLQACAKRVGLERFLTSEVQCISIWRYVRDPVVAQKFPDCETIRLARCMMPRRSLQDCMEAILGAAFLAGGIPMALHAGDSLGLGMGGRVPWEQRYDRHLDSTSLPPLFAELQENLGYKFKHGSLLIEAVTHPSFSDTSGSPSYQRLEFLGDALIDLVVVAYLFNKFPEATPGQLSWSRSRVVCSAALAAAAVQRLSLHKSMLANNTELSISINEFVPILEAASPDQIVNEGWKMDPPKAISDVFESVMGALLVDSGYNYEIAASVVGFIMADLLDRLTPDVRHDPISELSEWVAKAGCHKLTFRMIETISQRKHCVAVEIHDMIVAGPVINSSKAVAKSLASEQALSTLRSPGSDKSIVNLCTCANGKNETSRDSEVILPLRPEKTLSDVTNRSDIHDEGLEKVTTPAIDEIVES